MGGRRAGDELGARRGTSGQTVKHLEPHAKTFGLDLISRFGGGFHPIINFSSIFMMTSLAADKKVRWDWARQRARRPAWRLSWES